MLHQYLRSYGDGAQLRVSSDRLGGAGIELGTHGYKASDLSTTPWQLLKFGLNWPIGFRGDV